MFIYLKLYRIRIFTWIIIPNIHLLEAASVQRYYFWIFFAQSDLFGIGEPTTNSLNNTLFSSNICRRPAMTGWTPAIDDYFIIYFEFWIHSFTLVILPRQDNLAPQVLIILVRISLRYLTVLAVKLNISYQRLRNEPILHWFRAQLKKILPIPHVARAQP